MKFGVFLNQYYTPESGFSVTDLYEQAEAIERFGFDGAALGERHVHEEGFVEPITALAAIAARTETLDLSTMAMLPMLYDPLHLAEQVAMIDRLSDGRMHFGAAIGYREREIEPFGVPMDDRSSAFIESLHVLKRLWNEESVSHDGEYWSFDDVFISPRPETELPVWIGGHADIAIKRAAYRGNGWIASASSTTEDLEHQIGVYEDSLEEFGEARSDHDVVLMRDCFVGDSVADARETIEPYLLQMYEWYARWGQTYMDENEVEVDYEELEEKFVLGSPDDCIEQLREYEALGVDQIYLRCQFPGQPQDVTLGTLERFGTEVMPAFR
ncbi:LLM class flavin-dependent oxidoreductase [Halalkalicoccus subterraneus]|uniref:LLM class flavin-dependent oxidoreductase n=1 Tax=Halalkalicoccus subterraneus TaxID=2675002 RepID=UPI000EFBAB0F|nr:LLM class flavin-dependent oxidoreductase [Halalkalicoccus subterraneus]